MSTPKDVRPASGMGTPNEAPVEMDDAEDRTSRVDPDLAGELPPLPVETSPGHLRLVPKPVAITRQPTGAPADELIGRRCGGYVIEALLGEGGMGKVYLATNPRMGKRVAVKVIVPEHSRSPQTVDRFLQEAKAAAQIDDPNIIDVLDASELEDGRAYLLMPFVDGTSLEELCERMVVMPIKVAASILLQICGGLDAAHQHGIVHRDIKPHNILVGPRQQREHFVRIVDFGIAKLLDPHLAGKFKTQTKAMMGTPGYMAPEQASGERSIDARADVYAVAVVAYRMLTGRRPYMEDSLYALIEKQVSNAPFPRPRELRPDIPIEWDEAIMAALVNKREQRLATVRELALRLAHGIPDGEEMLRALTPRLATPRLPPNAPTLEPFLDHDIARRTGSQRHQRERPLGLAVWQLAMLGCLLLVIGGVVGGSLPAPQEPSERAAVDRASPSSPAAPTPPREAAADVAALAVAPAKGEQAPGADSPTEEPSKAPASSLAQPAEGRPRGGASNAAKSTRSPVAADPPAGADASGSSGSKSADAVLSREESARLAKLGVGMLIVNVQPWAQISINGKLDGYTPKRKELPAGRYTVRMTKDERSMDVVVTVSPGKVSTIDRSFR